MAVGAERFEIGWIVVVMIAVLVMNV